MSIDKGPQSGGYEIPYSLHPDDLPVIEPKQIEKEVFLEGMAQPIKIKVVSKQGLNSDQLGQLIDKNLGTISQIYQTLGAKGSLTLELSDNNILTKVSLSEPVLPESMDKAKAIFNQFKSTLPEGLSSSAAAAAAAATVASTPLAAAPIDPGKLAKLEALIRNATYFQSLDLTDDTIKKLAQEILLKGDHATALARSSGQRVLMESDDPSVQIVATKKGEFHIKVSLLGSGSFKDTYKFFKISQAASQRISATPQPKTAAVGIAKQPALAPGETLSSADQIAMQEHKNEINLHQRLSAIRKGAKREDIPDPLSHVALAKPIAYVKSNQTSVALMGKMYNGGSAEQAIVQKKLAPLQSASICADTFRGMAELHALGIAHRDIKSDNVLLEFTERILPESEWPPNLDPDNPPEGISVGRNVDMKIVRVAKKEMHAVLCDLGKASPVAKDARLPNGGGVLLFGGILPPGRWTDDNLYTTQLDIYSAGRLAYQLFAGVSVKELKGVPLENSDRKAIIYKALELKKLQTSEKDANRRAELDDQIKQLELEVRNWDYKERGAPASWPRWNQIPAKVQEFIIKMVDPDPDKRPTASECAAFFANLTPDQLKGAAPAETSHEDAKSKYSLSEEDLPVIAEPTPAAAASPPVTVQRNKRGGYYSVDRDSA